MRSMGMTPASPYILWRGRVKRKVSYLVLYNILRCTSTSVVHALILWDGPPLMVRPMSCHVGTGGHIPHTNRPKLDVGHVSWTSINHVSWNARPHPITTYGKTINIYLLVTFCTDTLRYVQGTKGLILTYRRSDSLHIEGYSDSDFVGDVDDRKSTSDYVFTIIGGAISWKTSK